MNEIIKDPIDQEAIDAYKKLGISASVDKQYQKFEADIIDIYLKKFNLRREDLSIPISMKSRVIGENRALLIRYFLNGKLICLKVVFNEDFNNIESYEFI